MKFFLTWTVLYFLKGGSQTYGFKCKYVLNGIDNYVIVKLKERGLILRINTKNYFYAAYFGKKCWIIKMLLTLYLVEVEKTIHQASLQYGVNNKTCTSISLFLHYLCVFAYH